MNQEITNVQKQLAVAVKEIEELRKENARLNEIVTMLCPSCEDFYHQPSEFHDKNKPCPVEKRLGLS